MKKKKKSKKNKNKYNQNERTIDIKNEKITEAKDEKTIDINNEKNVESTKEKKKKKKHHKLKRTILMIFVFILMVIFILAGVLLGMFFGLIKGDWALTENDLAIAFSNSTIYDLDGNVLGTLSGDENRIIISKDQMSKYLPEAFISIEDERFETHHGVDLKRTLGATLSFITHKGSSSYGGSTITQQAIKNLTGEDDNSGIQGALRKVKEMAKAYQLENIWSKDQIIELYLNLIPLGGDIYGVEMASRKYFNKSAIDLSLIESAYLAGITNAPSTYNPFGDKPYGTDEAKTKRINTRVTNVLYKMNQLGRLNDEEYQEALKTIEEGIKFEQGSTSMISQFSYHTEAAIDQIVSELKEKYSWTDKEARLHLYGGGYKIYTTEKGSIQKIMEDAYKNKAWEKNATFEGKKHDIQSAMVIIDQSTGYVVAEVGALGEKTAAWGTNRGILPGHSPGSSIKPIAVVGPSLQEGLITAASVADDTPVTYPGSPKPYTPSNDSAGYRGLMNIRYILRVSRNIPEVKLMSKLTVKKSEEYLMQEGVTTMDGMEGLALALGAINNGVSPLQMAGAYATIANNGVYIEPTFYTKVEDQSGKVLIETEQETHRVYSEQNAWILQSLLTEPTGTGLTGASGATATRAVIKGMQTCGKTGTANKSTNLWFCGFTPYYTGAMYFAYDDQRISIYGFGSGEVAARWASIMKPIHEGLENATFEKPEGITTARVCTKSGLLATGLCGEAGCTYTEYFAEGTVPTKYCSTHVSATICSETGLLASDECTHKVNKVCITRPGSANSSDWKSADDAGSMLPTEKCTHTAVETPKKENEKTNNENNNQNKDDNKNSKDTNTTTNTTTGNTTNTVTENKTTNTTNKTTNTVTNTTNTNTTKEASASVENATN